MHAREEGEGWTCKELREETQVQVCVCHLSLIYARLAAHARMNRCEAGPGAWLKWGNTHVHACVHACTAHLLYQVIDRAAVYILEHDGYLLARGGRRMRGTRVNAHTPLKPTPQRACTRVGSRDLQLTARTHLPAVWHVVCPAE